MKKTWVWDEKQGKLVPKGTQKRAPNGAYIIKALDPFVSPITNELITDRSQLRSHNKEYGVTDSRDYSNEFIQKRRIERDDTMTGNNPTARAERRELINQELEKNGY